MSNKTLPNKDSDFSIKVRNFATTLAGQPERYRASADEVQQISAAVNEYLAKREAAANPRTRSPQVTAQKREAREQAERVIRRVANRIRVDETIDVLDKSSLGIKERARVLRESKCPRTRPRLLFRGPLGIPGTPGVQHQLEFKQALGVSERSPIVSVDKGNGGRAKPRGVARVELFVELVGEGEPIPTHPAQLSGGRLWYVGSFTRNPIIVDVPIPSQPMQVMYWARWAGHRNNDVGPFSRTCMADYQRATLGAKVLCDYSAGQRRAQRIVITSAMRELPDCSEQIDVTQETVNHLLLETEAETEAA